MTHIESQPWSEPPELWFNTIVRATDTTPEEKIDLLHECASVYWGRIHQLMAREERAEALLAEAFAPDATAFFDVLGTVDEEGNDTDCGVECGYCLAPGYADPASPEACQHTADCLVTRVRTYLKETT